MLTKAQGKELLNLARLAISAVFGKISEAKINMQDRSFLEENKGVFVTLMKNKELRGCIGFAYPTLPLGVAVLRSAKSAAFQDPRFEPLTVEELEEIKIEVTVITEPKEIKVDSPKEIDKIDIGKDGLIVERGDYDGLLLPQTAVEFNWTPEEFLEQTCLKAGLRKNAWLDHKTKVFKFQGQIFSE